MAENDVNDAASSAAGDSQPEENAEGTVTAPDDRPIQNVVSEFNRKFKKTDEKLDAIIQWMANQAVNQQAPRQAQAQKPAELSDQDIFTLAQQGDQEAFAEWTRRQAKRVYQQENTQQTHARIIQGQLAALMGKYPALNNPQHPLTQTVNNAYALYLQNGYPAGQETLLKAATTAIADRPDLVAQEFNSGAMAREQTRRSASSNAQSGVTGVTHRNDSPRSQNGKQRLTDEQLRLARQMGLSKEKAEGSIARFHQRRADGTSKIGAVGNLLDEESL